MPGSAHSQAALAILRNKSLASTVATASPLLRAARSNGLPSSTARMNSSLTRTELLAFWYWTLVMSLPPRSMSKPPSRRARIFSSSRAFVSMNSSTSGWSTSSTTIFAARRVAPPDLIVPAGRAARRQQFLARAEPGQVDAGAGPALEDQALFPVPLKDRVHRVADGQDEAVVHPHVAGQVLPALGLDVVDLHLAKPLDP